MQQLHGTVNCSLYMVALFFLSATVFISCGETIEKTGALHAVDSLSTQTVYGMEAIETKFGKTYGRFMAPLMENYSLLPEPYEIFPKGIRVIGYTPEGEIETEITANMAVHRTQSGLEQWEVYGNVVIVNHLNKETMITDTLYWERAKQRIHTHAFVRMFSPQGLMQGLGMESDERATNVTIMRPFNSYGIISRDTLPNDHKQEFMD
jgi:LPS export ABC transporter protein LptC